MVSFRNQMRYNHNVSRCLTRQHHASISPTRPSLGFLSDFQVNPASPADADRWGELANDCVRDNDPVPPVIGTGPLSENPEEPRCFHGNYEIAPQQSSDHGYHMNTPFTTISSIVKMSQWQKSSSCYKNDHVQQKKGRRQRNIASPSLCLRSLCHRCFVARVYVLSEQFR
jgi:hypothetical protein